MRSLEVGHVDGESVLWGGGWGGGFTHGVGMCSIVITQRVVGRPGDLVVTLERY